MARLLWTYANRNKTSNTLISTGSKQKLWKDRKLNLNHCSCEWKWGYYPLIYMKISQLWCYQITTKRNRLRTLKQKAAYNAAKCFSNESDVQNLLIPQSLYILVSMFLNTYLCIHIKLIFFYKLVILCLCSASRNFLSWGAPFWNPHFRQVHIVDVLLNACLLIIYTHTVGGQEIERELCLFLS